MHKYIRFVLVISLLIVANCSLYGLPTEKVEFTILHTSDIHAHLMPFDCASGTAMGGYARIKAYKDHLEEKEGRKVILLSSGDIFQGTFFYRFFQGIPDIEFMNDSGYSAMALGNHEFDSGQESLFEAVQYSKFPILAANINFKRIPELQDKIKPWTIIPISTETGTVKVGVIGMTNSKLKSIVPGVFVNDFDLSDPQKTLNRYYPEIKKAGADIVLLLSHLGWEKEVEIFNNDMRLSGVLGGHSHLPIDPPIVVSNINGDRFISEPGEWGSSITRYDCVFDSGKLNVKSAGLIPMSNDLPEDAEMRRKIDELWEKIQVKVNVPISKTENFLDGKREHIRNQETNLGNLIADMINADINSDISVMNGGGIRASIATGTITTGDVLNVLPFDNYLVKLQLKGSSIIKVFDQVRENVLASPGFGGYLQVSRGVEVRYSQTGTEVSLQGEKLNPDKLYWVTTNDFLAWGGNGLTAFTECVASESTGMLAANAFLNFLKKNPSVNYQIEGRIISDIQLPKFKHPKGVFKRVPLPR